ncbi:MAG: SMP-30/gluconolactonase/LRE family protein [Balneolaceae bacterium]
MKNSLLFFITIFLMISGSLMAQELKEEGAEIQQITEGHQFTEGPFWHSDGFLLYSDIPANQIYKWTPGGEKEIFLELSGHSNGITADGNGGMITAQHDGKLSRLSTEGETTILADTYNGNRLNSPNDVAVTSNGTIYFTDPPYGVDDEKRELDFSGVYRFKEGWDEPELLYDEFNTPNGIVFSLDENRFYVNDTQTGRIMVFEVDENGKVSEGSLFAEVGKAAPTGAADGMVVDENGNLYSTGPKGIHIFDKEGNEMETVSTPRVTNLEFGTEDNRTLFMTSPAGVYSVRMKVRGN